MGFGDEHLGSNPDSSASYVYGFGQSSGLWEPKAVHLKGNKMTSNKLFVKIKWDNRLQLLSKVPGIEDEVLKIRYCNHTTEGFR